MARKDKGHREAKRPKRDKAKKGSNKPSVRVPLPEPERHVRSPAVPRSRDLDT